VAGPIETTQGYTVNPATAVRDAKAARMRSRSMTYQQIGDALEVTKQAAWEMVERAMKEVITEPAESAVAFELQKLDAQEQDILERLEKRHFVVSNGRLISIGDPPLPLEDDDFALRAHALLLRVAERRAKLLGLDSATKLDVSGGMTYTLLGADDV